MRPSNILAPVAAALLLIGCAREYPNQQLETFDADDGYRLSDVDVAPDEDVVLILTFSGGGKRATAFAMGVLEGLSATSYERNGASRSLLDEVDIISSASGGSVTAAVYGLHGRAGLTRLQDNFLYDDTMSELFWTIANPVTWAELSSPNYSRINILIDIFDERLLDGASYADLEARDSSPYVVLNAADMSSSDVFSFTQETFDLICSDLTPFRLADATGASAAFPVLLTPVTLQNHSGEDCQVVFPPRWWDGDENRLKSRDFDLDGYRRAMRALALRRDDRADHQPEYVHLLDGGLVDNLGVEAPTRALTTIRGGLLARLNRADFKGITRVAIIVVNARSDGDRELDSYGGTPGVISMLSSVVNAPIDRTISDRQAGIYGVIRGFKRDVSEYKGCAAQLSDTCGAEPEFPLPYRDVEFFIVNVDFDRVDDDATRTHLKNIATSWTIPAEDVDLLRSTAQDLLASDPEFLELMESLRR